jgi:hypothetical protein
MFNGLIELAKENRDEIESEIALYSEEPEEMTRKLIDFVEQEQKEYFTAQELICALGGFSISSAKDLANKLGKLGFKSRNLRIEERYRRYYHLTIDKLKARLSLEDE